MARLKQSTTPGQRTPDSMRASQHNALTPLFRLSPELRNQIYDLVLGGNIIHAVRSSLPRDNGTYLRFNLCQAVEADNTHLQSIIDSLTGPGGNPHEPYTTCHSECRLWGPESLGPKKLVKRLDVRVLQVCSQMHAEAALLPFILNTFAFTTLDELTAFPECVTSSQAQALRKVTVRVSGHGQLRLQKPSRTAFMGLRHLILLYECPVTSGQYYRPFCRSGRYRTTESLLKLRNIPFKSVTLYAYFAYPILGPNDVKYRVRFSAESLEFVPRLQARLREVETILLGDDNDSDTPEPDPYPYDPPFTLSTAFENGYAAGLDPRLTADCRAGDMEMPGDLSLFLIEKILYRERLSDDDWLTLARRRWHVVSMQAQGYAVAHPHTGSERKNGVDYWPTSVLDEQQWWDEARTRRATIESLEFW